VAHNSELVQLADQLGAQILLVRSGQHRRRRVHDRDGLVGPRGGDLAGQFEPDRAGAEQQHPSGPGEVLVQLLVAGERLAVIFCGHLGRERIRGPGGEHQDVWGQPRAVVEFDRARAHLDGPGAPDRTAGEQSVVRQERTGKPARIGQAAQRGHVVVERVARLDQHDVGRHLRVGV
jgi:hypothetical protein